MTEVQLDLDSVDAWIRWGLKWQKLHGQLRFFFKAFINQFNGKKTWLRFFIMAILPSVDFGRIWTVKIPICLPRILNLSKFYSYLFAKNCIKMILDCSIARRLPSKCTRKMKINERLNIGIRLRVYFLDCI